MQRKRKCLVGAASLALVAVSAGIPAAASSSPPAGAVALSATSLPRAVGSTSKVIVMLRDSVSRFAPRTTARADALHSEEAPFVSSLIAAGARNVSAGKALPYLTASVTSAQRVALARNPEVKLVIPDVRIPGPTPEVQSEPVSPPDGVAASTATAPAPSICGNATAPEQDPEALSAINATGTLASGVDGAGVGVAYIAGSIDPTIADFQRNSAYATSGSPAGSPVVTPVNFTGEPASTPGGDASVESFLDASSIAAQGNTVFDLNNFINTSHTLPSSPCDITITGDAPGANVTGLDVFATNNDTTESNFIEAIDYAVANGVLVLNESFGANNFPDTALDATRIADDDAVAAGVTVVVSSGDAGVTSTIGSPATDKNLISVGASTTFRTYEQVAYGGINATTPVAGSGGWIDNNISGLSSGGFAMGGGNTVDLVAPGDLNWILCSESTQFGCTDENGNPSPIDFSGGTSESAPLTSGAAADVIQAYAETHHGALPSPALVKQILVSTATDISAPADQQGAGLLNVLAAVKLAESLKGTTATSPPGGLLISPNQINVVGAPSSTASRTVSLTNTGTTAARVSLSTRALTKQISSHSGSFCLNPSSSPTGACGAPTANSFSIWSGVTEVYQEESFSVPAVSGTSRLNFSATYPFSGQSSLLHVALFDPSGAYAGYSVPQGLADYANIQVANPAAGTWTAVFFTAQDSGPTTGTSGTIQWKAVTSQFQPAGTVSPSSVKVPAGATKTVSITVTNPASSGDTAQSIVVSDGSQQTTIPVTVRTLVPIGSSGGNFTGVLTGGNGRGNPAAMNTYAFDVPAGVHDIDVSTKFADTNDAVTGFLVDPEGQVEGFSSSITTTATGTLKTTGGVNLYRDAPGAGRWMLVLDWLQPVSGSELSEPFQGAIRFNEVSVSSNLPDNRSVGLRLGTTYSYTVKIKNTGLSPQSFFADPRFSGQATYRLADLNGSDQNIPLPLPGNGVNFPLYVVPNDVSKVETSLVGNAPVTYDIEPWTGDPDLSPLLSAPGVTGSQGLYSTSLSYSPPSGEVFPGWWLLNPSEVGPYGSAGAPPATASANFSVVTPRFDQQMRTTTGDLWTYWNGLSTSFTPLYVRPGRSATITIKLDPKGRAGSHVSGSVKVDDTFLANILLGVPDSSGDELASLPFSYTVCATTGACP